MADVVFRPTYHKSIPPGAKRFTRAGKQFARFRTKRGELVEGEILAGGTTCRVQTKTYFTRIRHRDGRIRRVSLKVTDREAALQLRTQLQRKADQEKAGIIDPGDKHRQTPLIGSMDELPKRKHQRSRYGRIVKRASELAREDLEGAVAGSHLADYAAHLRASGCTDRHVGEVVRSIRHTVIECEAEFSADLDASVLERYLAILVSSGKRYRTRNAALKNVRAFINWMLRTERLSRDPFRTVATLNEDADPHRRRRRALTGNEFQQLLNTTRSESSPTRETLSGGQRATLFLLAAWTGYRKSELARLRLIDLELGSDPPKVHLPAAATKARRDDGAIPLHPFVAKQLATWVEQRKQQGAALLFDLVTESGYLRKTSLMMEQDCQAAGIAYSGDLGVADFHSHRLAFITHLSRTCSDFSLVSELARHRDPKLTAKIYDKVRLEDRMAAISGMNLPTGATSVAESHGKGANRS